MRAKIGLLAGLLLVACQPATDQSDANGSSPAAPPAVVPATVFTGGTIYTGNGLETVDTVVVGSDDRIMFVEPPRSRDWVPDDVTIIDLDGAFMYPGFVDGHAHLLGIGQRELQLNLEGTDSVAALVARVAVEAAGKAPGELVFGRGWIETGWPEGRMPTAQDLDAVAPDNPVILVRADGHALVANSAAMAAAWPDGAPADPEGGRIERGEDGAPTGIIIDNAMADVMALRSAPSEPDLIEAYIKAGDVYAARGWTGVHNMSVSPDDALLLEKLDRDGDMPLRLVNYFDERGMELAASRRFETDTIRNRGVKLYMDGALGSRGALLLAPYSDRPDTSGVSLMEPDRLQALMQEAASKGVQLAIHAIGDLANRRILDQYELVGLGAGSRWCIEHTQILDPQDIARVGALGLIASMQPSHAIGDLKFAPDRLGLDRLDGAYAWASLLGSGAVIVGGSDAPVEYGSPLIEFYAAVARKDLAGASGEGWHPEQALTREQALALFTSAPAFAAFMEDDLGTIEVGKLADFTVFDRDLMTIPEDEILNAEVVMTVVQGEIIL